MDNDICYPVVEVIYDNFNYPFTDEKTGKEIYSLTGGSAKDDKHAIEMRSRVADKARDVWGEGAFAKTPKGLTPTFTPACIKDGDETTNELCFGKWVIKGNNRAWKPKVIGTDNNELTEAEIKDQLYVGQIVMLKLKLANYDVNGKGITAYLQGVKIIGGGERRAIGEGEGSQNDTAAEDLAKASQDLVVSPPSKPTSPDPAPVQPLEDPDNNIPW